MGKTWNWILQNLKRGLALGIIEWIVSFIVGIAVLLIAAIISGGDAASGAAWIGILFIIAAPFLWIFYGWLMPVIVKYIK